MSRKGKQSILLPKNVQVAIDDGVVTVTGPKGTLTQKVADGVEIRREGEETLFVDIAESVVDGARLHGLYRSLIGNMVVGTSQGFEKQLELIGVGYRATVQGKNLDLLLGFSHPTQLPIPEGLTVKVEKNIVAVSGIDKQLVGQYCATVRSIRPPEPYQGKGVRYKDEYVRRKQGKASGKK